MLNHEPSETQFNQMQEEDEFSQRQRSFSKHPEMSHDPITQTETDEMTRDAKPRAIKNHISFMYSGEPNLSTDRLPSFEHEENQYNNMTLQQHMFKRQQPMNSGHIGKSKMRPRNTCDQQESTGSYYIPEPSISASEARMLHMIEFYGRDSPQAKDLIVFGQSPYNNNFMGIGAPHALVNNISHSKLSI